MKASRFALAALFISVVASAGCELIASVDRSQIPTASGGGGGGASTTSSTGGGGAAPQCTDPSTCPAPANECVAATCDGGTCGTQPVSKGTKAKQVKGNCEKEQCDGKGNVEKVADDTDLPNDGKECTDDVCDNGSPANPPKAAGAACGTGGKLVCDGAGKCVSCTKASDCGVDDGCKTFTCDAGTCNQHNEDSGTVATSGQTTGDCKVVQCDGNGGTMSVADPSDLPVDGNECTDDLCAGDTPSNPPVTTGTACASGTKRCDMNGICAECFAPSDCPGTDTECQARTCVAGACGTMNQPLGTALAIQTPGDCQKNVCDGNGGTTVQADDTDLPDDFDLCTDDVCTAGAPTNPDKSAGTVCGTGLTCDAVGDCTGCALATDCPGTDDECKTRTCTTGVCGFTFTAAGTATTTQTAGDCKQNQCDGAGHIEVAALDTDVPADDGNACTSETCSAGAPKHPAKIAGTTCATGVCDGSGSCVACNVATDCPGSDTDCTVRSCTSHVCGTSPRAAGFVTQNQTAGDCRQNQCDGSGNIVSVPANSDVPADDGNACTGEVCNNGVPSHPTKSDGTTCDDGNACTQMDACQAGVCTGFNPISCSAMDQCHTAGTCNPGTGTCTNPAKMDGAACNDGNSCTLTDSCQAGTCVGGSPVVCTASDQCHVAGTCDTQTGTCSNPAATDGTTCNDGNACTQGDTCQAGSCVAGAPITCTPSDQCHVAGTCDSSTGLCTNPAASDGTTCNDGNACTTGEVCTSGVCGGGGPTTCLPLDECHVAGTCDSGTGVCSNPNATDGTSCSGGTGTCQSGICAVPPSVVSTTPGDGTAGLNPFTTISVTFSTAMNPATLTTKTTLDSGACSGAIQLSSDNFVTCIPLAAPVMSGGNVTATMTPGLALAFGEIFEIRVTTAATAAGGAPLVAAFTTSSGFTTRESEAIVISQVYGGSGSTGPAFHNDFIELHNRGTVAVNLTGWSLQYASATSANWSGKSALSGTIPAGGYFLVQEATGMAGPALPTPDLVPTSTFDMAGGSGKVALVLTTATLPSGCPATGAVIDLLGYGSGAQMCAEGTASAGGSAANGMSRAGAGCTDTNSNSADFTAGAAAPRNSGTATAACGNEPPVVNETGDGPELDYCALVSPAAINVAAGSSSGNVLCEIYEAGVTDTTSGDTGQFIVELGYGPLNADPESQAGWTWVAAPFLQDSGNNDQYQAAFTTPVAGSYAYTCRVTRSAAFTYCDIAGAGSNVGLQFDVTRLGAMTTN